MFLIQGIGPGDRDVGSASWLGLANAMKPSTAVLAALIIPSPRGSGPESSSFPGRSLTSNRVGSVWPLLGSLWSMDSTVWSGLYCALFGSSNFRVSVLDDAVALELIELRYVIDIFSDVLAGVQFQIECNPSMDVSVAGCIALPCSPTCFLCSCHSLLGYPIELTQNVCPWPLSYKIIGSADILST